MSNFEDNPSNHSTSFNASTNQSPVHLPAGNTVQGKYPRNSVTLFTQCLVIK